MSISGWKDVTIVPEFSDQGVDCYQVKGGNFLNDYYIISEAESRKLMNHPEVVGYEVYKSLITATSQMMYYLKEKNKITTANILSILRGALNFPIEESCWKEHIRVHDMSFMSCERVFADQNSDVAGLTVKYRKITAVPGSTLMIGDIIASGDTFVYCLKDVIEAYRRDNVELRNIVFFTIGGTRGIEILEKLTAEIREFWPNFEGFIVVYYEGIFTCYDFGDKGVSGINRPWIDFIWRNGIVAPAFRQQTLSMRDPLFEKCTIYDGGARRYAIKEHIDEVLEFWEGLLERKDVIDFTELLEEKLGHSLNISYEDWVKDCHYDNIPDEQAKWLYRQELGYIAGVKDCTLEEIASTRIREFKEALEKYDI